MLSFRFLFLLFILVPFIEIYLLIEIGSVIGAPWTIFCVVLTAAIGAWLVRLQGFAALRRVQASLDQGGLPAVELVEGLFLLIAGALLLTPGFFTDAVGFLFLTPPVRRMLAGELLRRGVVGATSGRGGGEAGRRPGHGGGHGPDRGPIEGEYRRVDD